jgi:hypothetical protein
VERFKECKSRLEKEALCLQIILKFLDTSAASTVVPILETTEGKVKKLGDYVVRTICSLQKLVNEIQCNRGMRTYAV